MLYFKNICLAGVYGGLDLHGKEVAIPWTTLNNTVEAGETSIIVKQELDWAVDNEIVITPTGYKAWETETFKITAISVGSNVTTITLNDTVQFRHLGKST